MPQVLAKNAKPVTPNMRKKRYKSHPPLTPLQRELVEEHSWIASRLAFKARALTGGWTGMFTVEDLESVAHFALCIAATRYTPDRGTKFSTYAWSTARGYIMHALRDYSRMVRLPRWIPEYRKKLKELLEQGLSYERAIELLEIDDEKAALCELSWSEVHASYDNRPEGWRELEFVYSSDEVKQLMTTPEVRTALRELSDDDLDLLLAFVDDQPLSSSEREIAQIKLDELRELVYGAPN